METYPVKTKLPEVDRGGADYHEVYDRHVEASMRAWLKDRRRAWQIAYPLLIEAAEFPGARISYSLGCSVANRHMYRILLMDSKSLTFKKSPIYPILVQERSIDKFFQVEAVLEYPSELREGDKLLKLDNRRFPRGTELFVYEAFVRRHCKGKEVVNLTILRNGEMMTVEVRPRKLLKCGVELLDSYELNAFANGKKIFITRGMLAFTDDPEAGYVIGHEIAHNLMYHINATILGAMLGGVVDATLLMYYGADTGGVFTQVGARTNSSKRELEADYISLYLLARVGMEYENAQEFWMRMSTTQTIKHGGFLHSHPPHPHRFAVMKATVEEIREKMENGEALLPTYK